MTALLTPFDPSMPLPRPGSSRAEVTMTPLRAEADLSRENALNKAYNIYSRITVPSAPNVRYNTLNNLFRKVAGDALHHEEKYKRLMMLLASVNNLTDKDIFQDLGIQHLNRDCLQVCTL